MAVDLHNCELLIPSDNFDGLSMENSNTSNNKGRAFLFGSSEFGSELSSPIGSDQLSSSSTESSNSEEEEEEDCFIGEFTRQMAQYMLQDEDKHEKFYKLKQEQAMKQREQKPKNKHCQSKGIAIGGFNNGQKFAPTCNNPWYFLNQQQQSNQQTGSDMRAVFLNGSGSRTGSSGTGVFLPRGTTPGNSRKKQGCPTVLIPARVVQALKLHFEKTGVPSRFNSNAFYPLNAAASMSRPQKGRSEEAVPATNHHHQEMNLPQEWTY
ncbi:forkhead box protein P2-like [Gossypium australe]|uniref:Forkhead box protein P2-like n=1 Tax=Gossypium australe TaxID=47621 RepID=A0A5B6UHG3_9ROSI|nr:forkhead box protein P2-like [Gossypium australe]